MIDELNGRREEFISGEESGRFDPIHKQKLLTLVANKVMQTYPPVPAFVCSANGYVGVRIQASITDPDHPDRFLKLGVCDMCLHREVYTCDRERVYRVQSLDEVDKKRLKPLERIAGGHKWFSLEN